MNFVPAVLKGTPSAPCIQCGGHVLDSVSPMYAASHRQTSADGRGVVTCPKGGFYSLADNPATTLGTFENVGWRLWWAEHSGIMIYPAPNADRVPW